MIKLSKQYGREKTKQNSFRQNTSVLNSNQNDSTLVDVMTLKGEYKLKARDKISKMKDKMLDLTSS